MVEQVEQLNMRRRQPRTEFLAARAAVLAERDDLRGVSAFVDYLDDTVCWSA